MTKSIPLLVTLYILLGFVVLSTLAMPTYTAAQSHARIVVNTLSDTEANDFWCTLREAIKAANSNAAYWGCGYSPSPDLRMDTILFAESLNGVIELSSALPVNQDRLEIFSVPHRIAIDGKGSHRVFTNRGTLRLVGLKIQNGQSSTQGGAIYNESGGKLELIETTFQANRANQGGAIYNLGNVIIQRSTFLQNQSTGKGGAIANVQQGSVNIANSTFYQNEATQGGGGLWNKNSGAFLENVTFWENRGTPGTALLSEIGETFVGQNVYLYNSILASSGTADDCHKDGGGLFGSPNLIKNPGNCSLTPIIRADPKLGSLTGTPAYLPLLEGSPAIDSGDNNWCSQGLVNYTSQNGVSRPQDGNNDGIRRCDLGSFELPGSIDWIDLYLPYVSR